MTPAGVRAPAGLQIGVRWMRLDVAGQPDPAPAGAGSGSNTAKVMSPEASPSPLPSPASPLGSSPPTSGLPELPAPPPIDAVVAGAPDSVVTVETTKLSKDRLVLTVDLPVAPGRYRLVATIHAADGTAYDAPSQALIAPVDVRVSPPLSVAYGVVPAVRLVAGAAAILPVRLANDGSIPWATRRPTTFDLVGPRRSVDASAPVLIGHWVPLSVDGTVTEAVRMTSPRLPPGSETIVRLGLTAPERPGSYLLLIDLVSPLRGSLAAAGARLAEVRVTVLPATTAPVASPQPSAPGGPQPF